MLTVLMVLDVVFLHNINCFLANKANWFTFTCSKKYFLIPSSPKILHSSQTFPFLDVMIHCIKHLIYLMSTVPVNQHFCSYTATSQHRITTIGFFFLCQSEVCCPYILHHTSPSISPSYQHSIKMNPSSSFQSLTSHM